MTRKTWTREEIIEMLETNPRAVERAMVAIWKRQTQDEQRDFTTRHSNNIGFCGWSAKSGSYYAQRVQNGGALTGHHLVKARKIAIHHSKQLVAIANARSNE
jgi:hypothetical protein